MCDLETQKEGKKSTPKGREAEVTSTVSAPGPSAAAAASAAPAATSAVEAKPSVTLVSATCSLTRAAARGCKALGCARDAQVPVDPIAPPARGVVEVLSVPRDGRCRARQSRRSSRCGLGLLQSAQEAWRCWGLQPVVSQSLAWVHSPKIRLAVQVKGPWAQKILAGGRALHCSPCWRPCRLLQGPRSCAGLGLGALGIVVQPEVTRSEDAGVAVWEIDG